MSCRRDRSAPAWWGLERTYWSRATRLPAAGASVSPRVSIRQNRTARGAMTMCKKATRSDAARRSARRDQRAEPTEQIAQCEHDQCGCDRLRADNGANLADARVGVARHTPCLLRRVLHAASHVLSGSTDRVADGTRNRVTHCHLPRWVRLPDPQ